MGLLWLIVLAALLGLAAYLLWAQFGRRQPAGGPPAESPPSDDRETPREDLDRRFENGEISQDEYERTQTDLVEW